MNNKHRRWTRVLPAVILAGLLALSSAALAAGPVVLRAGHIFPTSHVVHRAFEAMADYVTKATNGGLKIEVYPLGQLGSGAALAQNVMLGTVDMGSAGPGLISGIEPSFGIWSAEYVFKNREAMFKAIESPVGKEIFNRLQAKGIRTLGVGYLGERHLTTSKKPVYKPSDLKGLKIRIPEVAVRRATFLALGASPTPMAMSELYLALQQGVVDGQENPLPQIYSMKLYEVQKYLILTGHAQNPEMLIINEEKFRSLDSKYQKVLLEAAKVFERTSRELTEAEEADLLKELEQEGMIVIRPDVEAFQKAVKDVPAQFDKVWGAGLYEKVLAAQE